MKLYSTVTSERASKGQGGNEYLEIDVRDENKEIIFSARIYPKTDEVGDFIDIILTWEDHVYINGEHGLDAEITTKGKKQKCDCGKLATKGDFYTDCAKDIPL